MSIQTTHPKSQPKFQKLNSKPWLRRLRGKYSKKVTQHTNKQTHEETNKQTSPKKAAFFDILIQGENASLLSGWPSSPASLRSPRRSENIRV